MTDLCLKPSNSIIDSISTFGQKKIISRKTLVLGDESIGKTSLLHVYARDHFPQVFEPTVVENHTIDVLVGDQVVELSLWDNVDLSGQDEIGKAGPSSYANVHVILLCFSVDKPNSLTSTENKWLDQIIERCPGVKICMAALKCDLRDDPETRAHLAKQNQRPVDYEEGLATARRIRASRYLECSARQNRGVSEAFLEVAKVSISTKSTSVYNLIRPGYRYFKRDRSSSRSCLIT
ncbi:Rho GTPase [Puccinia graminis f. sp. tritici]|uniref:Rho GTPase n=1 Tax=Puccinia graminis f. sp. tritici TaxID=56615 RepID=A0A5B0QJ54_PUCGR|nr:Rho GTPase [Puccinia graminis f. sp. tritici]